LRGRRKGKTGSETNPGFVREKTGETFQTRNLACKKGKDQNEARNGTTEAQHKIAGQRGVPTGEKKRKDPQNNEVARKKE